MSMDAALLEFSAAQRQRLAYIEFRVWFHGQVARKDVLERFEVATAAGTRDLALYRDLAPRNVVYERKAYHYLPSFVPLFCHDVDRVLAMLTSGFGMSEPATSAAPISHAVPVRLNQPRLEDLATVTRAIQGGYALGLTYHSITDGPQHREIVPHALVDSGLRWHARAFDRTRGRFQDLVLTRMAQAEPVSGRAGESVPEEQAMADEQWNRMVVLHFVPHPAQPYPRSIERDLGMRHGRLTVTIRAAVAGYMLRQWLVDCSRDACLKGPEFRLWLADVGQLDGVSNAVLAPGYEASAQSDGVHGR
ncbi:WYL domain-containing protein [Castellaniella sp.]|uniref:WYL domain-containing protein n=2 Tax=Castellaniella sp. TaxID=1955812 RepID=UPI003568BE97